MTQNPFPFGFTKDTFADLEISFLVASTKAVAGFDEIVIRGGGEVELRAAFKRDDPPQVRNGAVDRLIVARLLQLLVAEGIEGWDEVYPSAEREYVGKLLTIRRKEETVKQVSMCQKEFAEFSRAYGAIKLVASLACPEVVTGEFFNRI